MFASSAAVYSDYPVLPKREDMIPDPKSPYAVTKIADEHYCRVFQELYGIKTMALRCLRAEAGSELGVFGRDISVYYCCA
ncbi:MAG: NAD-dependent epimerase/dehydratase family protein [Methanotrichaceae archaeon]